MKSAMTIRDLGLTDYAEGLALQESLCAQRLADEIGNTVLLTEHEPVITLGARKSDNRLLWSREQLTARGAAVHTAGRGGAATAHNPGQMVIYPILKLKTLRMGLNEYVRTLAQIGLEMLDHFGIKAIWKKEAPGLWIGNRKIGSIGIQARKWITMHGMAVNICNDLSIFEAIIPCGLEGIEITSVQKEIGKKPAMTEVKEILSALCKKHLCSEETTIHDG